MWRGVPRPAWFIWRFSLLIGEPTAICVNNNKILITFWYYLKL